MKTHLKNFFIPHEGNNYHPHILHTKRAIFYSGVFLSMKVIVFVFAMLLPLQVFVMPDVLAQLQSQVVALTNDVRAREGRLVLSGDEKLYASSQMKADDMSTKEYFEHVSPEGHGLSYFIGAVDYDYAVAGENLAIGFSDAQELMQAWIDSPTHYANLVDTDYTDIGVGISAGEYHGQPTVYVAQHFGSPRIEAALASAPMEENIIQDLQGDSPEEIGEEVEIVKPTVVDEEITVSTNDIHAVEGTKDSEIEVADISAEPLVLATEDMNDEIKTPKSPTVVYQPQASRLFWEEEEGKTVVSARAYIVGNVASAIVRFNNYSLELAPTEEPFIYKGQVTIFKTPKELFGVMTNPSISVRSFDGTVMQGNIAWQDLYVSGPTPMEKYTSAKTFLGGFTKIFDVSRGIYLGFIIFFSIALALKVFIEFKKQHPHVIFQTVLLIGLLVVLFEV